MKIGFALPQLHTLAHHVAGVAEFAKEVENAGAASLWVGDRNFAAVNPKIGAGGIGNTIPVEYRTAADPFVVLGVAASATERVQLGTHVLIAPVYAPVQLTRALTTIDLISGGRLIPGYGVGWSPEEYEGANLDFSKRGARMDEMLDALDVIWANDPAEYHGKHIEVPLQHAPFKSAQRPRPPVYLGGSAEAALRRIGERGDGWLPLAMPPLFGDADMLLAQRAVIDRFATEAGRNPADIDTVLRINIAPGVPLGQIVGVVMSIAERTGIDHFMFDSMMTTETIDASLETVHEILALVDRG